MFTRILTQSERRAIEKYLKRNGEKEAAVRELVYRARKHLPQIRADLELLEKLLKTYRGKPEEWIKVRGELIKTAATLVKMRPGKFTRMGKELKPLSDKSTLSRETPNSK
mgnify:CR=1 FL=1